MQTALRRTVFLVLPVAAFLWLPVTAGAFVQDFGGFPAGFVLAGEEPGGGTNPGTTLAHFALSVVNNGGGPNTLIVFDSANPTGNDPDLGSPNETCPGCQDPGANCPGVGVGGEVGTPGENCVAQGNLMIIAGNNVDDNNDDLVDDPNDEPGGGEITFDFDDIVVVKDVTIMDIDDETATFELFDGGVLKGTVDASDLGDNSAQTIDLQSFGAITKMILTFSSSGAVSELEFNFAAVPVREMSWGTIKSTFE